MKTLFLEEAADAKRAERELRKAGLVFTARRAATRVSFLAALADFEPDIVVAGSGVLRFGALAAIKAARKKHPNLPIVIVTDGVGDEAAAGLIKAGANGCVVKDGLGRLAAAVEGALREAAQTQRLRGPGRRTRKF